jgi:hypothetical protein
VALRRAAASDRWEQLIGAVAAREVDPLTAAEQLLGVEAQGEDDRS